MAGWIYVMKNESMPGLVKIGRSSQDPSIHRVKELSSSTSVPVPFTVSYQALVENEINIEKQLHDHFRESQYGKEYFKDVTPEQVAVKVSQLTDVFHEDKFDVSDPMVKELELHQESKRELEEDRILLGEFSEACLKHKLMQEEFNTWRETHNKKVVKEEDSIREAIRVLGWPPDLGPKNGLMGSAAEWFGWQSRKQLAANDKGLGTKLRGWSGFGRRLEENNIQAGEYRSGLKNGHCTVRFFNGDTFSGMFREDEREGFGIYSWASGGTYEGQWSEGKRSGWGIHTSKLGEIYVGEMLNGERQGFGEIHRHGVFLYRGSLQSGKQTGFGWGRIAYSMDPSTRKRYALAHWIDGTIDRRCDTKTLLGIEERQLSKLGYKFWGTTNL